MNFLEYFFYQTFQIFYVIGMVTAFTGIPIFILFWKKWLPKTARTFFWAKIRRTPPLFLAHDSGRGEITTIQERRGEGIVKTRENKYKILPRVIPKENMDETKKEQDAETMGKLEFLNKYFSFDFSDWTSYRSSLVGLNLPFWIGYTGKICLLNPVALAMFEAGDMIIHSADGIMFNPHNIKDKNPEDAVQPLMLLEARKIKAAIYKGFDTSQVAACIADTEEEMRVGKGINRGALMGIFVIAIIGIMILMFILPGMLPIGG